MIAVAANAANLGIEVALVYGLGLGLAGSAWGTVLAQYGAAAAYLVIVLRTVHRFDAPLRPDAAGIRATARVGSQIMVRTAALLAALTAATALAAARSATVAVAAHQIAFQVWTFLALSLDAIAIAAQAMVGRFLGADGSRRGPARRAPDARVGRRGRRRARHRARGPPTGHRPALHRRPRGPRPRRAGPARRRARCSRLNALVFVLDGILLGAGDAAYLAGAMVGALAAFGLAAAVVVVARRWAPRHLGRALRVDARPPRRDGRPLRPRRLAGHRGEPGGRDLNRRDAGPTARLACGTGTRFPSSVTQPPEPPVVNLVADDARPERRNPLEPPTVGRPLARAGPGGAPVPCARARPTPSCGAATSTRGVAASGCGRSPGPLYDPMYRYWFRAEWEGLENIPTDGGALIVANHAAAIPSDAPGDHARHRGRAAARRSTASPRTCSAPLPVVGTLWSRTGGVPAHPDNAYRLLHDEQQLVLVFPEGAKGTGKHYRDRYKLRRFGRGGFVEIAMRAGVPIVPIAVVGAEESMPILWKSKRLAKLLGLPYFPITANTLLHRARPGSSPTCPAKFKLRVLPPVHLDAEPDQERYSRSRVMEESERIREQIQVALYDMLRTRRSVWFG